MCCRPHTVYRRLSVWLTLSCYYIKNSAAIGWGSGSGDPYLSTSFPSTQLHSLLHFPAAGSESSLPECVRPRCKHTHTHAHTLKNACRSRRDIFRAEKLTENRSVKHQRHPQRELEVSPPNQRFPVFPDLPGAEERRRVSAQHKGVPQGLHIIPRRGEYIFSLHSRA